MYIVMAQVRFHIFNYYTTDRYGSPQQEVNE